MPDSISRRNSRSFGFWLNRKRLREVRRRDGPLLLRTDLTESDPAKLWEYHPRLVAVEEVFKTLKGDVPIRPVYHQHEDRIEAHIIIAFLAYCLHVTLGHCLKHLAPGPTTRSVLAKFAAVQMIDVLIPTSDGRELAITRYTQPEPDLKLRLEQLKLTLPAQPPPQLPPCMTSGGRSPENQCIKVEGFSDPTPAEPPEKHG